MSTVGRLLSCSMISNMEWSVWNKSYVTKTDAFRFLSLTTRGGQDGPKGCVQGFQKVGRNNTREAVRVNLGRSTNPPCMA